MDWEHVVNARIWIGEIERHQALERPKSSTHKFIVSSDSRTKPAERSKHTSSSGLIPMLDNIQPGVKEKLDSPKEGERVTLIVGVEERSDAVVEQVEGIGAVVEERLPYDSLAVSIAETRLEKLCDLDVVTSVEIEGKWKQLGNFRSRQDTLRWMI